MRHVVSCVASSLSLVFPRSPPWQQVSGLLLSVATPYSVVQTDHSLPTRSQVGGQCVCFRFRGGSNDAAMNTRMRSCADAPSRLVGVCLGVELLGHTVTPCFTFGETARLFSKVTVQFYIPSSACHFLLTRVCFYPIYYFMGLDFEF